MTTKWTISTLERETSNGFITTAHWVALLIDGEYSASIYSTSSWEAGTPTIPYENVTMAEVLDWIWANGVDKTATEAALTAQIANKKAPVTGHGVPWTAQQEATT
jgi:hypothetical protein